MNAQAAFLFLTLLCQSYVHSVNITDLVFGDTTNYMPAAFGDFNSDKHTDMIVLTEDGKTVKVLISDLEPPLLRESAQGLSCTFDKLWIKSIVPGDFDGNGAMDLLLVSLNKTSRLYEVFVLWGNQNVTLSCAIGDIPLIRLKSQPLVMDVNGDMIPDLFGDDQNGNRTFWIFGPSGPPRPELIIAEDPLPPLKLPSSHAFIDLDSDLAADLWITAAVQFEIWVSVEGKYRLNKTIPLPEGMEFIGQTSFADVNLDGNIEAIIPVCSDASCKKSYLALYELRTSAWKLLDVDFVDDAGMNWVFPFQDSDKKKPFLDTVTLRVGDFNLDGYPDFLVTLVDSSRKPRVILMENTECDDSSCEYKRKFVNQWKHFQGFGDTVLGTFCDFQEDGTLDVLLVKETEDGKYRLNVYKDSVEYDAVFIKVLIGGCFGEICKQSTVPYGTPQPGPSITYSITTATGNTQHSRATQLSQTAHNALQLPYTIFGLGRNWNFVEVLDVGIPKGNNTLTLTGKFTQIIPNSQLIVIPYPMEHPDQWVSKLFITPSKAMLMTAGALIGTCLFVAAIIGVLHRREKQQDKREKQQEAHKFHFDAM